MPSASTSSGSRPLPGRPSLRYLKLEAKRRLAAGEFPARAAVAGRLHRVLQDCPVMMTAEPALAVLGVLAFTAE